MHEENQALEAQNRSLQLLVSELLLTNENLRRELARGRYETPNERSAGTDQ